ncbi:MAG: hypothetical protein IKW29_00695 [Bacteroidaceae bacterium]|nr:hypothetical protein [Bacteroidaceae bacterium]
MKSFLIYILLLFCSPLLAVAQRFDGSNWMSRLDDERTVASLSIPGAHDAATGEGLPLVAGLGKTQQLTLAEQWECGVRAFDLRPAVNGEELHIYHGPIRTKISFGKALEILCNKLAEHPTEFAIVLLREESDSENSAERALWPQAVGKAIENIGDKAAIFSPAMKVGNARGKIIFISRNRYTGCDRGAFIAGWSHSQHGSLNGRITSYTDSATARLQIQDYYTPTDNARQKTKESIALQFLDHAAVTADDVWTINFLSGYNGWWSGLTGLATSAAYKRNAEALHPVVIYALASKQGSTGIVMMDFAGCNKVCGGILHWGRFRTMGSTLLDCIIRQNFIGRE